MIASLRGTVTYKSPELRKDSYFVVEAAGVGYKVYSPLSNLQRISEGAEVVVYTYLAVSENAMDLYGFLDPADKTFFTLLLEVPGIGPKSAIGILGKTTMSDVQQAIFSDDPSVLTKISGLGQKTAEKIIITLKDKVESLTSRHKDKRQTDSQAVDADVFDALVSFGYSAAEARKALTKIDPAITDTSQKIKEALKILGK
ncbi:MAG: Holliday junction branch migration protein RuvA [Candidatus Buchananbacteria bacterium]|nr:Holliday junction branch migration protein RuvA [Candidatus Buchananbacteria bacterium]